jgi:hypothetical protein
MPQMKGMKDVKLLVQQLKQSRYGGDDRGENRTAASLAISAFFLTPKRKVAMGYSGYQEQFRFVGA